jgi:hypothetical protein
MRTILIAAPQLALASFLSEIWETRPVALKRTALIRTSDGDDDLPRHRNKSKPIGTTFHGTPGFNGLPRTSAELVTCNFYTGVPVTEIDLINRVTPISHIGCMLCKNVWC